MNNKTRTSVLLIEDNKADVDLFKIHMQESSIKHDLLVADTFFEGIDFIQNNNIDIALLDLTLPDSSGFKTLSNFLEKAPNIPVIVLTGVNNEIIGNQSVKAGAQDFLVKGQFDGKLLGRSIRYALQRFKTHVKLEEVVNDLAISKKRYIDAQNMAHFGNWELDLVSNEMTWADEIYCIFGFQPNGFAPTLSGYLNYVHVEDKSKVEDFFNKVAKDGNTHNIEHRVVVEGKNIKHLALQAKAHFEEINNKILLIGVLQDITERKISEQLIIEKNITNKASKIKEEALADMSFHIRTPLSSIINLMYLMEKTSVTSQQKEFLDGLKTSVDDLSIMVNNMLNFSVLVSEKISLEEEEIATKDFFQGIQKVFQIKADNSNVQLNFNTEDKIIDRVICDSNKLTQILYNLFDHLIESAADNSQIDFNMVTSGEEKSKQLCFDMMLQNDPLTEKEINELLTSDRILQVYNSQSEDINKRQLGMAIVVKLIKTMNGSINIKNAENGMNKYSFYVPVSVRKKTMVKAGDRPDAPIKILLVEDHFLNQIATKKILTTWSDLVTVDIAENGLIGVEKYFEHGYDIILMDIQMPVMNGIEAARKIREKSEVPIIALTASSTKQESDRCFETGINDYMVKPFKPEDLYTKIMTLLVGVPS